MKTITTGTKITFKETGDKFSLTLTETGFDVKAIKLSKGIQPEPYLFKEFLEIYESDQILIDGFEEADKELVSAILTNYILTSENKNLQAAIENLNSERNTFQAKIDELTAANTQLASESSQLKTVNDQLADANEKLSELQSENKEFKTKNEKLNQALEAMHEQE